MPFPPDKTAKELGIDTTRKFVLVKGSRWFDEGCIVDLTKDDDTPLPWFRRASSNDEHFPIHWHDLDYAPEPDTGTMTYTALPTLPNPFTKSLTQRLMNIFKSEPEKSLREAGLIDGDDMPTDLGVKYWIAMQLQDKAEADEFKREVADKILEKK